MNYRKAKFQDVEKIYKLIKHYADQGMMLIRPRNMLYESLREFVVAEDDAKQIVAVGGLHIVWDELAEVRALAVDPALTRSGMGRTIVEALTVEARELGAKTLFTLTYQPGFFAKLGFRETPKEKLSPKVWKECINCAKFPNCDEIAMIKKI